MSRSATDIAELRARLPYRDCVGIALFNRDGLVFLGKRKAEGDPEDSSELGAPWQMPQGGIDAGETPLAAARRELREETNVRSIELIAEAPGWIHYDLPDDMLGIALRGRYRGQRQRWFAFLFIGEPDEIDIDSPDGHKPEFDGWRWDTLETAYDIVVDFKRPAYAEVLRAFADIPHRLGRG